MGLIVVNASGGRFVLRGHFVLYAEMKSATGRPWGGLL